MAKKKRTVKKPTLAGTLKVARRTAVALALPLHLALPVVLFAPPLDFLASHLNFLVAPVVIALAVAIYAFSNYSRTHPPKDKRGKPRRPVRAPRVALKRVLSDSCDIIANLDHLLWRAAYLAGFVASIAVPLLMPVSIANVQAFVADPRTVLVGAGIPAALALALIFRIMSIMRGRLSWIDDAYAIARDCLEYKPLPERGIPTKRQRITATPHLAIEVRRWKTLTEGDTFFVWVPEKLSASNVEVWDELGLNLDEKMPRPEEWRIRTKGYRGRGALIGPANYPRQILWDGEYDPDPLTFGLGDNLEEGDQYTVTLNDASPHAAISGGTSSGKTSGAEIIAAQVLVKPMPWDPSIRGQVHILDPKGPFAQRWCGRPGVVVSNGQKDSGVDPHVYNDDGDIICEKTGVLVMAEHMQYLEDEHKRRADVLSRYPDAGTWVSLPDDVKRQEKFFPILVITDEFLDHTSGQRGKGARVELENDAREFIVSMTDWQLRKARNVGIHYTLIAQRANMKLIGDTMMTNMPIRLVTGQIDKPQLTSMFAIPATDVPRLPSTFHDPATGKTKTIPGRARILNALGQPISKIQIMWFGGKFNSETLDKWLPRGEKPINGDFSLPKGTRARTKEDFDAEGNFVGEMDDAARKIAAGEVDEVAESSSTDGPPTAPLPPRATAVPADPSDDAGEPTEEPEKQPVSEEEDAPEEKPTPGIFPAAAVADTCGDCEIPSSWACPECQTRYCTDHGDRTRNPDPDAEGRFLCGPCAAHNPYVAVGLAALLPEVIAKSRRYSIHHDYSIRNDDHGQFGQLYLRSEEGGKKIVEVSSRAQEGAADDGFVFRARTSSGAVEGLAAVQDRIDLAVATFVRKRQGEGQGDEA